MDDIQKPRQNNRRVGGQHVRRPRLHVSEHQSRQDRNQVNHQRSSETPRKKVTLQIRFKRPHPIKRIKHLWHGLNQRFPLIGDVRVRIVFVLVAILIVVAEAITIVQPYLIKHTYALGPADLVLQKKDEFLAKKLVYNQTEKTFDFNASYKPGMSDGSQGGGPKIKAIAHEDPFKGVEVSDPINNISFTIKPKYPLLAGQQDGNRVVYPLLDGTGWLVYTMNATEVKEDVVLSRANGDRMVMDYELDLGSSFEAKLEKDGSIGVYGSDSPLTGQVNTGSEKDVELLQKARKNAKKDKVFFSLPAPTVFEANQGPSVAKAKYELKEKNLKVTTTGLKKARFPLTIDPTITVNSTSDLFRDTNNDFNAKFDANSGNITRGLITGGVIGATSGGNAWTTNANNLATARFLHSSTIYDDYAYVAGGAAANTTTNQTTVEYARLNGTGQAINSWSTTTALPAGLSRFQLIAYNGYLYAVGGSTSDTTCGTRSSVVYYNRIQVNGQLTATWNSSNLPAATCGLGATIYNGRMYIAGGRTGSGTGNGVTTVAYATLNPDGSLTSFTTSSVALPAARYDLDLRSYNGYLYVIGGNLAGTLTNTTLYAAIASDGSIYGSSSSDWKSSDNFTTARSNMGANFTVANYGFMYLMGGCQTYNGTQSCTAVMNDFQVAQINADGSLGTWTTVDSSVSSLSRIGAGLNEWRGYVYSFAGCTSMNSGTISCATGAPTLNTQSYAPISSAGQVSPKKTNANALPTGLFAHGSVVNNGYIYVVGGCVVNTCQTGTNDTTGNTSYATLNADGTVGSWTTDSTNLLNAEGIGGDVGLAGIGLAVYNNFLYATGGYTDGGPSRRVYYVGLNKSTGALTGAWTSLSNKLAETTYYNTALAYRGFLFVFGGCIGTTGSAGCSTYRTRVSRMPINTNGSLGTTVDNTTGGSGLAALPTGKALMAGAMYNGYMYLAGGATSAVGQTNNVYYGQVSSTGGIASWSTTTANMAHTLRRADAVAMNGHLYVFGGHDGTTGSVQTFGDIQIGKINMSTGNITSNFTSSVIQITPRWDLRAVYSNGYIYATGGCSAGDPPASCSTRSTLVEYVELFNAGNKGANVWTTAANSYSAGSPNPGVANRVNASSIAYNGYIYVVGGCRSFAVGTNFGNTFCNTLVSRGATGSTTGTVAFAPINPDGTLGTWQSSSTYDIPAERAVGCVLATAGYLYYAGGEDSTGTATSTVYYSQIGSNGVPGAWATASNGLPAARGWTGCAKFNDRIYVTGGLNTAGTPQTNTYYSPSLASGGDITSTWSTTSNAFTTARQNHSAVAVGGYLYIMGGDDGSSAFMDSQFVGLNPSTGNTTGAWAYATDLPQRTSFQSAVAANGYIYLFGGRTAATTCLSDTYVASFNNTGTLSEWSKSANSLASARFGIASTFYSGYFYALGGNDCTNIISTNVIQHQGQQSQAMKTLISKYGDFNGDGTPWSFVGYLTQAQNNSVDIEKWVMTYKSSASATNSWGVTTSINPLNTDIVNTYTAYDGSGTNVRQTRWVYLTWSINMEQSFTFTDDTQPSITQYQLYYAPPPSKRLMHGRDFRDQTQQDLDTRP